METDNKAKHIPEEKTSGNLLNPKEEQMFIELPGVLSVQFREKMEDSKAIALLAMGRKNIIMVGRTKMYSIKFKQRFG